MTQFYDLVDRGGVVLADGAMGTELELAGLGVSGGAAEELNITHPVDVQRVHVSYVAAGSDIVLTNSFGGNRFVLATHGLQERVYEINRAAAEIARAAADGAGREVLVAGSIGPCEQDVSPSGPVTTVDATRAFAEQASGLVAGGIDLVWIETMADLDEIGCALEGVRSVTDLPVVVSLCFDTAGKTSAGVCPGEAAAHLAALNVAAIGVNCGGGPLEAEAAVAEMMEHAPGLSVVCKANLDPSATEREAVATHVRRLGDAGAAIVGFCCGGGPEHIGLLRSVVDESGRHRVDR